MGYGRKTLGIGLLICFLGNSLWASPARKQESAQTSAGGRESVENLLHALSLYVLAAEVLDYFQSGDGTTENLASKYAAHPGWIPAFARSIYDEDERVLYVPLGQCIWKIYCNDRGGMEFGFLHPKDKGLKEADRMILVRRLFLLANEAQMHREVERSDQNARLAGSLLYESSKRSGTFPSTRSAPAASRRPDFDNSL